MRQSNLRLQNWQGRQRHLLPVIIFFLFTCILHPGKGQSLFFECLTDQKNAPNLSVFGLNFVKDSVGFIWIGSWNGLYRYDGNLFEEYKHNPDDNSTIPDNKIRNLLTDSNQQLWILTFNNKFITYSYAKKKFITVDEKAVALSTRQLLRHNSNQLYGTTKINNFSYLLDDKNQFASYNHATQKTQLYYPNLWQPGHLTDDFITSFYIDDHNFIWLASRNNHIYKVNTARNPFNLFHVYPTNDTLKLSSPVRAISKINQLLWLGTHHNGTHIKNETTARQYAFNFNNQLSSIRAITTDDYNKVWIGGASGLLYYDLTTNRAVKYQGKPNLPDIANKKVFAIEKSKTGWLWISLNNRLLYLHPQTLDYKFHDLLSPTKRKAIIDIEEDSDGNLWLATEGEGIVYLTIGNNGVIKDTIQIPDMRLYNGNLFKSAMIYSLFEDQNGNIWAGSSEGILRISQGAKQIKQFTVKDGLQDNYISAITSDKKGNIWLSHKKGISKIEAESYKIFNYSITGSKANWTFMENACYNDTATNTIYFGAKEGYVSFSPDNIHASPFKPKLLLTELYLAGQKVNPEIAYDNQTVLKKVLYLTDSITLNYTNRSFSIDMTALHYSDPQGITFNYRLENYDDNWLQSAYNRVTYTKVPPGKYIFKARAVTLDGSSSETVNMAITILSPWYTTWWAYCAYIGIVLIILFVIYNEILTKERLKNRILLERINIEKREELNRERIEFFTNVTHELKTPLTLIIDPIKKLRNGNFRLDKQEGYWELVSQNIDNLTKLINQLLDFRKAESGKLKLKPSHEDVVSISRKCVESFYMNASNRNIILNFLSDTDQLLCSLDRSKLEQILFNVISNAFKYTSNGGRINVTMDTKIEPHKITYIISDNGIGIAKSALNNIFEPFNSIGKAPFEGNSSGIGLALTKNLITLMEGEIAVESTENKGTTVRVLIPCQANLKAAHTSAKPTSESAVYNESSSPIEPDDKTHILVVEDNLDIQKYLRYELDENYHVAFENNGIDGLKNAIENTPDIIISDIMMPYMDGLTLCRKLKHEPHTCHIPVILLTAKSTEDNKIDGLQSGADYYIPKPFNMDVLKAQLDSIVNNRSKLEHYLASQIPIAKLQGETKNTIDNDFLVKAFEIIQTNLSKTGFNNNTLAAEMNMSQRQLHRKLKAISGSTIQEFILRVKMDEAEKLLLNTSKNISEISYELGFSEPSNFTRKFTQYYGESPTKWQKANQKDNK